MSAQRWSDGPVDVLVGDVRERLADLAPESVQCVVTSPPYWGLRDYGTATWEGGDAACDHQFDRSIGRRASTLGGGKTTQVAASVYADCPKCGAHRIDVQLGLEATPELYVEHMVEVFREVWRVLRKDGTLWLNLGDSYAATTKGSGGHNPKQDSNTGSWHEQRGWQIPAGLKPKDLVGIPWRVAFALQADGWWLRSDIIWSKPNPMPESVTDRPTKAHEYLFLLTKAERYYYDVGAIAEPFADARMGNPGSYDRTTPAAKGANNDRADTGFLGDGGGWNADGGRSHRNRRTVWEIPTTPYPGAHFATFPEALVEPCIKAGSREGDTVLDPFAGSGTTLAVARRLGRKAIGIELQPDYLPLIQKRVQGSALPLMEAIASMDTSEVDGEAVMPALEAFLK